MDIADEAAVHPGWAAHVISVLMPLLKELPHICTPELRLHMWSDCAGLCSEMCAAKDVEAALRRHCNVDVKFILYGACDSCPHSKKFVLQNHQPLHWADNITAVSYTHLTLPTILLV